MSRAPIIIIGMHRSGTTLITQRLAAGGMFIGKQRNMHEEARFFVGLNNWLLQQAGGAWDNPVALQYLLDNAQVRNLALDYLRYYLNTPRLAEYLGIMNFLRYRHLSNMPQVWGWKDPRNTLTLPIWQGLFPDAKVIHIVRHGVDVAASLMRREHDHSLPMLTQRHERFKRRNLYWLKPLHIGFADSIRCMTLEGAFSLWETYMQHAIENLANIARENKLEIQYETLLEQPEHELQHLADFTGIALIDTGDIDASRAYGYRRQADLVSFAEQVAPRLATFGY